MPSSVAVPARKARTRVPDAVHATVFTATEDVRGRIHQQRCSGRSIEAARTFPLPLDELSDARACDICLRAYRIVDLRPFGLLVDRLVGLEHHLSRARKDSGGDTRRTLRLSAALSAARTPYAEVLETSDLTASDRSAAEALLVECDRELSRLGRLLRSPEEVERVLAEVRASLGLEGAVVDDAAAVVGIHPYDPAAWDRVTHALVEQLSVRTAPLVLAVPRYVVEYLALRRGALLNGFQASASVEGLPDSVVETAAHLWEPRTSLVEEASPLSTLAGAVAAARGVVS